MEKDKSKVSAIPAPSGAQAGRDGVTEVDPYKMLRKKGVLGFERAKDFEEVTNFDIEVGGYRSNTKIHLTMLCLSGLNYILVWCPF